jgi:hypothetical protein
MIMDDGRSHFIYVCHPEFLSDSAKSYMTYEGKQLTNKEYLEHWGKWIILEERERLDELAKELDPYVDNRNIPIIKYDRVAPRSLGGEVCAMLIFSDDRQRDDIWQILSSLGVSLKAWMYDRQTMEMWLPGGVLLENWLAEQGIDGERAERIRGDARRRFTEQFGREDAPCRAWEVEMGQSDGGKSA